RNRRWSACRRGCSGCPPREHCIARAPLPTRRPAPCRRRRSQHPREPRPGTEKTVADQILTSEADEAWESLRADALTEGQARFDAAAYFHPPARSDDQPTFLGERPCPL